MEYPSTHFTRPLRRLLLAIFILAFFVSAPIIILYSIGYRYDWQNGFLKETGSISIDVLPKNTTAYLDGLTPHETMPVRLPRITPHKYFLRLSAPGYYDWDKEIEVKNKQTTYIKEIHLLKKGKPENLVKNTAVQTMAVSPLDHRYVAYTSIDKRATIIWLYDNDTGISTMLISRPSSEPLKLEWASKNNYLAVSSQAKPFQTLLVFDAASKKKTDVRTFIPELITKWQWRETTEPELYVGTEVGIKSFAVNTQEETTVTTNIFQDWLMENDALWTLQFSTTTNRFTIVKDTLGFSSHFSELSPDLLQTASSSWHFLVAEHSTALIKGDGDSNALLATPTRTFSIVADTARVSPYGNWLLMRTPLELWTYAEGEEPYLLNRSEQPLEDILPIDEHNTLALIDKNKTTALFPYYFIRQELPVNDVIRADVDPEKRLLYFANKEGLWKLEY